MLINFNWFVEKGPASQAINLRSTQGLSYMNTVFPDTGESVFTDTVFQII